MATQQPTTNNQQRSALGIIAGSGHLPAQLTQACHAAGRSVFIIAFEGITDPGLLTDTPHAVVRLGAVGEALGYFRNAGVREIVIAGKVKRPPIASLRPDATGARMLAHLGKAFFAGDDALLRRVIAFLEGEGFTVIGSQQVLASLVAPAGVLGKVMPDAQANADMAQGFSVAKAIGALDIGQAVIIENGYVLGVEAAEGTDALIARCAQLRRGNRSGVLVKARKPMQDSRVDLPTIGVSTVERVHEAGLVGIAIEASGSLILDHQAVIARADALGIFIVGIRHE